MKRFFYFIHFFQSHRMGSVLLMLFLERIVFSAVP